MNAQKKKSEDWTGLDWTRGRRRVNYSALGHDTLRHTASSAGRRRRRRRRRRSAEQGQQAGPLARGRAVLLTPERTPNQKFKKHWFVQLMCGLFYIAHDSQQSILMAHSPKRRLYTMILYSVLAVMRNRLSPESPDSPELFSE
jgi:hypothetical protein